MGEHPCGDQFRTTWFRRSATWLKRLSLVIYGQKLDFFRQFGLGTANYFTTYKRVFDCLIEFTVPADEVMNETGHRIAPK